MMMNDNEKGWQLRHVDDNDKDNHGNDDDDQDNHDKDDDDYVWHCRRWQINEIWWW